MRRRTWSRFPQRPLVAIESVVLLVLLVATLPVLNAAPTTASAETGVRPVRLSTAEAVPNTPEAVLRRAEERFRSLTDYQCRASLETRLGERRDAGEYHVYVKLPRMLRVHVDQGRGRGSDVAMARDGTIRGRKGGILRPFVMRLDADDKRLRSIRGGPVTEFDWGSFYQKLRNHAALPGAHLTLLPRAEGANAPYELVVTYPSGGKQYREVTRIDPSLWVMVEGHVYEENVLVDHVRFYEIQMNTGLTDNFFRL